MNYRRIQPDSTHLDKELDVVLDQIGKWHNLTPKLWIQDYKVSAEDVERTIERIKSTKKEDLFLAIAEDEQNNLKGFLWAYKQENPQNSVMILSLYVEKDCRGHGVASKLKGVLEEWCSTEGIKKIQTTVHYTNSKMIKLNQKLGYVPGMVFMTKTL